MIAAPEFSRPVRVDSIGAEPRRLCVEAEAAERDALARRFGIAAIHSLRAEADLTRSGEAVTAVGTLSADVTQSCVASGDPVGQRVEEPFRIEFRPHPDPAAPDDEVELSAAELDVVFYAGPTIDLGEAVAETLSLGLDPYPRSPAAEAALRAAGVRNEEEASDGAGPFAGLAALKDKLGK